MVKKIAVCVGLNNYAEHTGISPLRGCVNDALLVGQMLRHAGFEVRQVHNQGATMAGILDRLESQVARLKEGDHFVFWISSHGYQIKDRSGDELHDGLDEAICSYDTDVREPFSDDRLATVFSRANPDSHVFVGCDTCHSGTMTRAGAEALVPNAERDQDFQAPRLWVPTEDVRFRGGQIDFDMWALIEEETAQLPKQAPIEETVRKFGFLGRHPSAPPSAARHVLLAACKSDQVSWDAYFSGQFHGAMTFNFAKAVLSAWKAGKSITYQEAHQVTTTGVRSRFDQDPQLEGPDNLIDLAVFGFIPE